MNALIAQGFIRGWGIGEFAIAAVFIMGVIALVFIASKALGFTIPG